MSRVAVAVLAFLAGLLVVPLVVYAYLAFGRPPVAVADAPFPMEQRIVHFPLGARIRSDRPGPSPIQPTDENLNEGAGIYQDKCASCHGLAGEPSGQGSRMFPQPPQFFQKHADGEMNVSDDPVEETYWKVKNGIRLTGMPSYKDALSDQQMWQVSLLLSRADKPLPTEAAKEVGLSH